MTEEEWSLSRQLLEVLNALRVGTKLVEGEKRPTISVVAAMLYINLKKLEAVETGPSL